MTWLLCRLSKSTEFQCGGSELTWFHCRDQNQLGFVWGAKMAWLRVCTIINLVFVSGGVQNWFDCRLGVEIDLTSVLESKLTVFLCGGYKLTWFYSDKRNWLVFVRGSTLTLFLCAGRKLLVYSASMEIDGGGWWWSKLTWSQSGGSNLTWFQRMDEINLVVWVVEVDLLLVCRPKITLFLGRAWKLTWFLCRLFKLTWFQCGGSSLTGLQCRDDIDLVFVWVVEIDLVFERGTKITCFGCEHVNRPLFFYLTSSWGIELGVRPE